MKPRPHTQQGFSLVELAIVVVLMSIMLTLGITAFSTQMDSAAYSATQKRQEVIKDALVAYLRDHRRLPCPETSALDGNKPTGAESRASGKCPSYWGTVPYAELGLQADVALDGYGNLFTYFVSTTANPATEPDWTLRANPSTPILGFDVGSQGRFSICADVGSCPPSAPILPNAAVVLISHGKNGFGAFTVKGTRLTGSIDTREAMNTPPSPASIPLTTRYPTTIYTLATGDATATFDDIVMVIRPNDLLSPLIKDGAFKSPQAQVQDTLVQAIAIIAAAMPGATNNCQPPATPPSLPNDPWGIPLQYKRINSVKLKNDCGVTTPPTATNPVLDTNGAPVLDTSGNPKTTTTANCFGPGAGGLGGNAAFMIWSAGANLQNESITTLNDTPVVGSVGDDVTRPQGINVSYTEISASLSSNCP